MAQDQKYRLAAKQWIDSESFWNLFCYLELLPAKMEVSHLFLDLEVEESMYHRVLFFYQKLGVQFEFEYEKDQEGNILKRFILPPKQRLQTDTKMGQTEWMELLAHFPFLLGLNYHSFLQTLAKKMIELEAKSFVHSSLKGSLNGRHKPLSLEQLKCEDDLKAEETQEMVERIEKCLLEKMVIELDSTNLGHKKVFPLKLVFLADHLQLIAEEIQNDADDGTIIHIPVNEIYFLKENWEEDYESHYGVLEINQFINGLRVIQDHQVRLIIKFKGQQFIDPPDQYHHFTNPYIVANNEGDYIWAATTEISQKIYKWLMSFGERIEILDPQSFKLNFEEYCQKNKTVLKKTG